MKTGIQQITDERATHPGKGFTASHDDTHAAQQLAAVAINLLEDMQDQWGISEKAKKEGGRIRQLVVAGALIAAEIDRIQRLHMRMDISSALHQCPRCLRSTRNKDELCVECQGGLPTTKRDHCAEITN